MRRLAALALISAACGSGSGDPGYDYGSEGARLYTELCAVCHGEAGEGGLGPVLQDTDRDEAYLASAIDGRMPANDPARCTGDCADKIAAFIREGLTSDALDCTDRRTPSPRRLRLLTRFEYANTLRDVLGVDGAASPGNNDCQHTFAWSGQADTVHVAGSFNNWAGTLADGGWALARSGDAWSATFSMAPGTHSYKIVIDESTWLTDPQSPMTEPDGFGGENSVIEVSCGGGITDHLPAEVRADGFPFETGADVAVVTTSHLEAYMEVARPIAEQAAAGLGAEELVDQLGPRLFRRPLDALERARYLGLATTESPAVALEAMLVSPHFLYRSELGEPAGRRDGRDIFRLTNPELASAMSYMLWGSAPDAELRDADLRDLEVREAQARRLLADPRSREMVGRFAIQWLGGEPITTAVRDGSVLTDSLRRAMVDETKQLAAHVVFDGRGDLTELLTADYTVASPELARFYGLEPGAETVSYRGDRAGVLGHGSVLGSYAHSDQTSPIRRGLFVRRRLLCQELPPPPPSAGGVPDVDPNATTRDRFAQHTDDPVCAGCHQYIDGLGFAFERFDPIGRYRETEAGAPIDTTGVLRGRERLGASDEHAFASLPELAQLVSESPAANSCFVRQMVRFSRGYRETLQDRCVRLSLEDRFNATGGDIAELMIDIVLSDDFEVRR